MASSSRSTKINKIHKVLKKAGYEPVAADLQRSVLEHLLFAACLENAQYDAAEQAFAALVHNFYDWNEVRVTTIRELAEEMSCLPDAVGAAQRVKGTLQSVFESKYNFDLEDLRKENLGPATERLQKLRGVTRFAVCYVVQSALGGHAIPLDAATMHMMEVLGLVKAEEVEAGVVPGLERAVAKHKGVEFGSLLHQFAVDFAATPHKPELRKVLMDIDPEAAPRLPKRRPKKTRDEDAAAASEEKEREGPADEAEEARPKAEKAGGKPRAKKDVAAKPKPESKPAKDASGAKRKVARSKTESKPAKSAPAASAGKRSATKGLSKKKPR